MPLLDDDKRTRLHGISKSTASRYGLTRQEEQDVFGKAVLKILNVESSYEALERFDPPFVREMVRNLAVDELRKRTRPVHEPKPERHFDERVPPLCVVEARLKLIYAQRHSDAHELLVYAHWSGLQRTPSQIVDLLGDLTVGEGVDAFFDRYSKETTLPARRLHEVYSDLHHVTGTSESKVILQNLWRPADQVEDWARGIAELVPAVPPFNWSKVEKQAVYKRVLYLLHKHLGMNPASILAIYGTDPLESVLVNFEGEYMRRHGLCRDAVRDLFGPMLTCDDKKRYCTLNQYCLPTGTVSDWIDKVRKKLMTRLDKQEELGLRQIFSAAGHTYRFIVYVESSILRSGYKEILRTYSPLLQAEAVGHLATRYAASILGRSPETNKTSDKARGALRKKVMGWLEDVTAKREERTFAELVEREGQASESAEGTLARWRSDVARGIKGCFGCHKVETVMFAWHTGLIAPSTRRERGIDGSEQ